MQGLHGGVGGAPSPDSSIKRAGEHLSRPQSVCLASSVQGSEQSDCHASKSPCAGPRGAAHATSRAMKMSVGGTLGNHHHTQPPASSRPIVSGTNHKEQSLCRVDPRTWHRRTAQTCTHKPNVKGAQSQQHSVLGVVLRWQLHSQEARVGQWCHGVEVRRMPSSGRHTSPGPSTAHPGAHARRATACQVRPTDAMHGCPFRCCRVVLPLPAGAAPHSPRPKRLRAPPPARARLHTGILAIPTASAQW